MKKKNKNFNKIMASTITASVVASALVTVAPNANAAATNFKDVQTNAFFHEAVNSLQARNIISGYDDGTFRPNEMLTRAQAAKIIALALDLDTTNSKDPGFKDVSKQNWAYKYIAALAHEGIVAGSDGEYKPNNPITRAEMAKVISLSYNFQAGDSQQLPFTDVNQDDWFKNYIGALVGNQITSGTTPTTFSPHKNVTRGQMVAFVYRSENKINQVLVNETISNITNETLVTSGGTYKLSDDQKKWLNPSNLAALKGAILKLTSTDNKIENIQSIELTAKGTASTGSSNPYANHVVFDGKGATIDANVVVNGDYITLKNITLKGNLHVGKGAENSFFSEFTKVEGKTTIDDSLQVVGNTQNYKSLTAKVASTNNFPVAVNETTKRGRVVFSEFQMGDVGVDKNADVIFLSKTSGTSTVGEIVVNSNTTLTAESSVALPKVIISQGAADVAINSNITSLQVTTTGKVRLSGKSNIVRLSLMTNANVNLQTIGRVSNLEIVNKETKVTVGTETKIGNLVIPTGSKPADIIENYYSVKGNVEQIGGTKNPDTTPPSTDNSGSGSGSTDTIAPTTVTGLVGSSLDTNPLTVGGIQNIISWTANTAPDLSHYEVFRSTNPIGTSGATKVSSNIAKGITKFTDISVVAGTTYYYTVYAVDTSGNQSASSSVAMVATANDFPILIPAGPIGLQGVSPTLTGNDGKITGLEANRLYQYKRSTDTNWTDVPLLATEITGLGVGNYEVRFAANGNFPASLAATVSIQSPLSSLATINAAQNKTEMEVALEAKAGELGLILTDYSDFNFEAKSRQASVAQYVFDSKPNGGYTLKEQVQDAFNHGVAYEKAKLAFSEKLASGAPLVIEDFSTLKSAYDAHEAYRGSTAISSNGLIAISKVLNENNPTVQAYLLDAVEAQFKDGVAPASDSENPYKINEVFNFINNFTDTINSPTTLLETTMLDGKDGVSPQDGKVETIRMKFSSNINPSTVNNQSFSVEGFIVDSIKVTDKNGRVIGDPLFTIGQQQYITIKVTPENGTHFTPRVRQRLNAAPIKDILNNEIKGINVQANDGAAPVIIESAFSDLGSIGIDVGDKITITFSEMITNIADIGNDFTLNNGESSFPFIDGEDTFEINDNVVTVTLGSTTTTKLKQGTTITINSDASIVSIVDKSYNKTKPQKELTQGPYSSEKVIEISSFPTPSVNAIAAPSAIKAQGTDSGTIKLTGLTNGVEYAVDYNATTSAETLWTGTLSGQTEIDNLNVKAGEYVHIRIASTGTQAASDVLDLKVDLADIKPADAPVLTVESGSSVGTTKLAGLTKNTTYEYFVDSNPTVTDASEGWEKSTTVIIDSSPIGYIDNIPADISQYIHIRVKATTEKPASYIKDVQGKVLNPGIPGD